MQIDDTTYNLFDGTVTPSQEGTKVRFAVLANAIVEGAHDTETVTGPPSSSVEANCDFSTGEFAITIKRIGVATDNPTSNPDGVQPEPASRHDLFLEVDLRAGTRLTDLTFLGSCTVVPVGVAGHAWEGVVQETGS